MTAKTLNIAPLNAIFSRELGRFWPSWLYSFLNFDMLPGIHVIGNYDIFYMTIPSFGPRMPEDVYDLLNNLIA